MCAAVLLVNTSQGSNVKTPSLLFACSVMRLSNVYQLFIPLLAVTLPLLVLDCFWPRYQMQKASFGTPPSVFLA